MRIEARSPDFSITPAMRDHVSRCVEGSMGWAARRVRVVTLHMRDLTNGRSGRQLRVTALLSVYGAEPVVVTASGLDLYALIGRACERAARRLARDPRRPRRVHAPLPAPARSSEREAA